jgi:seryl-tRNA synthetase
VRQVAQDNGDNTSDGRDTGEAIAARREQIIMGGELKDQLEQEKDKNDILENRRHDVEKKVQALEDEAAKIEENAGVKGCRKVKSELKEAADQIGRLDVETNGLLMEIAPIVEKMTQHVKDNEPKLKSLVRTQHVPFHLAYPAKMLVSHPPPILCSFCNFFNHISVGATQCAEAPTQRDNA